MIARLSGTIIDKSPGHLIVETGGVGFNVTLSLTSYYGLPDIGEKISLLIHTHIREDAIALFGFTEQTEKELFEKLINISGIGPKLGINILSGICAADLIKAILNGDIDSIVAIPGIGKKSGERIILELKDKLKGADAATGSVRGKSGGIGSESVSDAISALANLGYKEKQAKEAVEKCLEEVGHKDIKIEELIRESLKYLAR
ncbi:MAG: Holliday junction branch migration protein RuvA [Nitrospinae bacterium]|nr:Holliday junction branch migration protein RuvA [Nitrospinota bacterium]